MPHAWYIQMLASVNGRLQDQAIVPKDAAGCLPLDMATSLQVGSSQLM